MTLLHTLYPRDTPLHALETAPRAVAPGALADFAFTDVAPDGVTHHGETTGPIIVDVSLHWESALNGIDPVLASEVLNLTPANVKARLAVMPQVPELQSGPLFASAGQMELGIPASNAPPSIIGRDLASVHPVATQTHQVDDGRVRIWLDPQADGWDENREDLFNLILRVQNDDASKTLRVVFTVSDAVADLPKPWLHVNQEASIVGGAISSTLRLLNYGTGEASGITATLTNNDSPLEAGQQFITLSAAPATLAPGAHANLIAALAPDVRKADHDVNVTIASNDSAASAQSVGADQLHNNSAVVKLNTGLIELYFVVDSSGSMSATLPNTGGKTRWQQLQSNFNTMFTIIDNYAAGMTKANLVVFPKRNGVVDANDASEQVSFQAFNTFKPLAQSKIGSIVPSHGTPLVAGLDRMLDTVLPASPAAFTERWLVLMTDGQYNMPPGGPAPKTRATALRNKRVTPLTIRLLEPTEVDPTLQELVTDTNAAFSALGLPANGSALSGDDVTVTKGFIDHVVTILGLSASTDPEGQVTVQQPTAFHEFTISPTDRMATFVISWRTRDPQRLHVELLTPGCESINSDNAANIPGVIFNASDDGQIFTFSEAFLAGGGESPPNYGTWRLLVTLQQTGSPPASQVGREHYLYALLVQTSLSLSAKLESPLSRTGDPISIVAALTNAGMPVTSATLWVEVARPVNSRSRFLAETLVPSELYEQVRAELAQGGVTDPQLVKAEALRRIGRVFAPTYAFDVVPLSLSADGKYRGEAGVAVVDGTYDFKVVAVGDLRPGMAFRREATFNASVSARPSASTTTLCVTYGPQGLTGQLELRPRDANGVPLLFDPANEPRLIIDVKSGSAGPLVAQADGSYLASAKFDQRQRPIVSVFEPDREEPLIVNPLPPVPTLVYVDDVLDQLAGAVRAANQSPDADSALGPFDPDAEFFALGARGFAVFVARKASEPSEVCVFVRDDRVGSLRYKEKREYAVDVPAAGESNNLRAMLMNPVATRWVEIGRSDCMSSFPLPQEGRKSGVVRIRDLSGRSGGPGSVPLPAPGVNLLAVGFVATMVPSPVPDIDLGAVTIAATQSVTIGNGVTLQEPDGTGGTISNQGADDVSLAPQSRVGAILSIGAIRANAATIDGDVQTSRTLFLEGGAQQTPQHTLQEGVALNLPDFSGFKQTAGAPGTIDVALEPDQIRRLEPGSYGHVLVKSRAKLVLKLGTYFFKSLTVEPQGVLDSSRMTGLCELHVAGNVIYRGSVRPKSGRANLLVVSYGTADFIIEAPFVGTAVALASTLRLQGAPVAPGHAGAFFGKSVVIEPGWTIEHLTLC